MTVTIRESMAMGPVVTRFPPAKLRAQALPRRGRAIRLTPRWGFQAGSTGRCNREKRMLSREQPRWGIAESAREGKGVRTGVESKTGLRSQNKSSSH